MAELPNQFTKAKAHVEPSESDKENAAAAHQHVRDTLGHDEKLKSYEIATVLIGSYKRNVSIRRVKDVDVLSKLPALPNDKDPQDLLDEIKAVLSNPEAYGNERVKRQTSSVKVLFPDYDLHVDVVPARSSQLSSYLEIPNRDGGWQETNPEALTQLSSLINALYDDMYVPMVKLIRQVRRAHLGKRPGGLFFEMLTYHAFDGGLDKTSVAKLFVGAMESIAVQLDEVVNGGGVSDPTRIGQVITVRASDEQMQKASEKFAELAGEAKEALAADRCQAAKKFRDIFLKNTDGDWVFEIPAACNEDGTPKDVTFVSAGDRHIPAGDGRFA